VSKNVNLLTFHPFYFEAGGGWMLLLH